MVTASDLVVLGLKALNGGLFVVMFALIAEGLRPKRFAGLFSAAPSVAMANLLVGVIAKGHSEGRAGADGMLIGAAAMTLACLAGVALVSRARARRGSLGLCILWAIAAFSGYMVIYW